MSAGRNQREVRPQDKPPTLLWILIGVAIPIGLGFLVCVGGLFMFVQFMDTVTEAKREHFAEREKAEAYEIARPRADTATQGKRTAVIQEHIDTGLIVRGPNETRAMSFLYVDPERWNALDKFSRERLTDACLLRLAEGLDDWVDPYGTYKLKVYDATTGDTLLEVSSSEL